MDTTAGGGIAIGIDLGTANTRVAVFRNGRSEIIPIDGATSMPSYVAFTPRRRYIGPSAHRQAAVNAENTVFGVLRLVGRKYKDADVQNMLPIVPFRIVRIRGRVGIQITFSERSIVFAPEQILAMLISKARKSAELFCRNKISGAVITIPSYFSMSKRQSIRDAARIAGVNVIRLSTGPAAAALNFGGFYRYNSSQRVLFVDLGAGSCRAMIATVEKSSVRVAADSDLRAQGSKAGWDLNEQIVHSVVGKLEEPAKHRRMGSRQVVRLLDACEIVKKELSTQYITYHRIEQLFDDYDLELKFTRQQFEEICNSAFNVIMDSIASLLELTCISKESLHRVVLFGGSSQIPALQRRFKHYFSHVRQTANPEHVVVWGAALEAAYLFGQAESCRAVLIDVVHANLSIVDANGTMTLLTDPKSTLPHQATATITPREYEQRGHYVPVLEHQTKYGQQNIAEVTVPVNCFIGVLPQVEFSLCIDIDHNLSAVSTDRATGWTTSHKIGVSSGLDDDELKNMKLAHDRDNLADETEDARLLAVHELESFDPRPTLWLSKKWG